jgi:hypothetical protein
MILSNMTQKSHLLEEENGAANIATFTVGRKRIYGKSGGSKKGSDLQWSDYFQSELTPKRDHQRGSATPRGLQQD